MKLFLVFVFGMLFGGILIPSVYAQEEFDEEYVAYILDHIESIRDLLAQTKEEYANGNSESAMKLATTAYLEHYEYIEFELLQYNEELIEDVEWAMREELRGMIRDGAPVSEVEKKADEILIKLDDIAAIVPEFGVIAALVLSIAMLSTIFMLKKLPFPSYRF